MEHQKNSNKAVKTVRSRSLGLFKSGALASLLKSPLLKSLAFFRKIMLRIYILIVSFFIASLSYADDIETIRKAAESNNCIPAGNIEKKYAYLKHLKKWYIKSEANNSSAIFFWCKNKGDTLKNRHRFFIVISSKNEHPWSNCPSIIKDVYSTPTNLILYGLDVSAGYHHGGGYYFSCKNKKWQIKSSD